MAGAIVALLIIGVMGFLTTLMLLAIGFFGNKAAYDKKKRQRLVNNIYAEQMLVKEINKDLDSLPWYANFPWVGTRWWVRRDLRKMGLTL